MARKKRKHSQYATDEIASGGITATEESGIAATLARLQGPNHYSQAQENHDQTHEAAAEEADSWTVVGRGGKKRKTNNYPALVYADLHRQQSSIKLGDLQSLVLYCLADGTSPSWISVRHHAQVKKAVVLFVPGLEKGMFDGSVALDIPTGNPVEDLELNDRTDPSAKEEALQNVPSSVAVPKQDGVSRNIASPDDFLPVRLAADSLPQPLKHLAEFFEHLWPVKAPGDDKHSKVYSPIHHMLNTQVPKTHEQKAAEKAVKGPKPMNGQGWESKRTPITSFLSSKDDLRENDYVLHPVWFGTELERSVEIKRRADAKQSSDFGWIDSRVPDLEAGNVPENTIEKDSLAAGRTVLAMDCEMCTVDGGDPALTRISLVSWDGEIVMDELVKPDKPIINYLTQYSGITPEKMQPITTTLSDIQKRLLDMLTPNTILIGHSLNSDLEALKLTHPFIVDTSLLYPHPRGPPMKSSLKWLAQKYIGREIQKGHGTLGHDSVEDSRACLDLVKKKCEKGPEWGSAAMNSETIFKRLSRTPRSGQCKVEGGEDGKIGAIIDHGAPGKSFGHMAAFCIGCNTDAEVVEGVKIAVAGDPDGSTIPGGGVDFTWA
ncbi:MAG: hypothetical protein Q9224_003877, partial [Gallowayella concinna]